MLRARCDGDRPPVRRDRTDRDRPRRGPRHGRGRRREAWDETARLHGIVGRVGADGTSRGLTVGGPPQDVAAYLAGYRDIGVGEVIVVFRAPFDVETIERLGEVRTALAALD